MGKTLKVVKVNEHTTHRFTERDGKPFLVVEYTGQLFGGSKTTVWEPASILGSHARIQYAENRWWGDIETRRGDFDVSA